MIRVKSTHPSFRKMVLVDEDFLASQLEHPASSTHAATPANCASECLTQPLKATSDDRPIAPVEAFATTLPSTKPTAAKAAKRQGVKTRPVPRSFKPGHAPKVLRLY